MYYATYYRNPDVNYTSPAKGNPLIHHFAQSTNAPSTVASSRMLIHYYFTSLRTSKTTFRFLSASPHPFVRLTRARGLASFPLHTSLIWLESTADQKRIGPFDDRRPKKSGLQLSPSETLSLRFFPFIQISTRRPVGSC